jgi:hypothetical protein
MKTKKYSTSVSICLRGDKLDPDLITNILGVKPSRSQYRGEKRVTPQGREYTKKNGAWTISIDSNTTDPIILCDDINKLTSTFGIPPTSLHNLEGVEDAYIDVFIAADPDEDGGGSCAFQFNEQNVTALSKLGLPIHFTIEVVTP